MTIHYGNPGTGKTLFAMKDVILPCVLEHRPFFTNITGISLAGLSAVSGVHQAFIRYYYVENIQDVVTYFDDDKISHNGVFILDEMKDFIDNDKAISWLESRINVMRKQVVDFVLIAQQPKKEYIHPNIIELADSCNVYVNRKRLGDTTHVTEYKVNGGIPKIFNKVPTNSVGSSVRKKPTEMFSCYQTSESEFYNGGEDKTYSGLMWYQERKWKLRFILVGIAVLVLGISAFIVYSLFTSVSSLGGIKGKGKEFANSQLVNKKKENGVGNEKETNSELESEKLCYHRKICDDRFCDSDIGRFETINVFDNKFCTPLGCFFQCEGTNQFSSRRRLLRASNKIPAGKESSLHNQ